VVKRPEREADHSHQTIIHVQIHEFYFHGPYTPSWNLACA